MDINQMNAPEAEEVAVEETFDWPQAFYTPTDGEKRKAALDKAIAMGLEPEKNEIRKVLWERRYGQVPGTDQFLKGWINLNYYASIGKNSLMAKFHRKEMLNTQKLICLDLVKEYGPVGEELLFLELYHLVDFYIDICLRDKKYGGVIMGLGTLKKEKLIEKIATEVYRISYSIPPHLGLMEEYPLLTKAATRCYYNRFPNDKEVLRGLISNS